jgi:hypothetical protein
MFKRMMSEISPWRQSPITAKLPSSARVKIHRIDLRLLLALFGVSMDGEAMTVFDRVYDYCEAHVQRRYANVHGIDLPSIVQSLDMMCKQTSNTRIRFFYHRTPPSSINPSA